MKLYNKFLNDFEDLFVGYSTVAIILSACLGAAASMVVLMNGHDFIQMIQLFAIVVGCMTYLVSVLAHMKVKFVFNSLIVSLILSFVLLIVNVALRY